MSFKSFVSAVNSFAFPSNWRKDAVPAGDAFGVVGQRRAPTRSPQQAAMRLDVSKPSRPDSRADSGYESAVSGTLLARFNSQREQRARESRDNGALRAPTPHEDDAADDG